MELTIGMASYDDFEGVYFTVQALRLYQDLEDTEIVVVDNYGCELTKTFVEDWTPARYVLANVVQGTAPAKTAFSRKLGAPQSSHVTRTCCSHLE
jgi:hypothetical protein